MNATTCLSSLNVSGSIALINPATCSSSYIKSYQNMRMLLNVSGITTLNNITTYGPFLNVSGNTTLNNTTPCLSSLNVSGSTRLNNTKTCLPS